MNQTPSLVFRIKILLAVLLVLGAGPARAGVRSWTNTLGGNWFVAANWLPNGVPTGADSVVITSNGTYSVLVSTGTIASAALTLGGSSGTQTLIFGTATGQLHLTNSVVRANGVLTITNSGIRGNLAVQAGGRLNLAGVSGLQLYSFALTNEGTVVWSSGSLSVGGSNSETSYITNGGLWQITGNGSMGYGGGSRPVFHNSGTLRKLTDAGTSYMGGLDLINLPTGLVDVQSGLLQLVPYQTNVLGGTWTVNAPGAVTLFNGTFVDSGGLLSGNGLMQFTGGTLVLRTNILVGLKLTGGDVYLAINTFQQAGAITNLTLDGASLHGTNRLSGTLNFNSGSALGALTVLPSGQLQFDTAGNKLLYGLSLYNQGTVNWLAGGLSVGGTPGTVISNGSVWNITGDSSMSYGGGSNPLFTNIGTILKSAGSGSTAFGGVGFYNQGLVQVNSGTFQFPNNYTNTGGLLRLNGGTFASFGGMGMTGGMLEGTGAFSALLAVHGGTVSPGASPGAIQFKAGLHLGTNATLAIDGNGLLPGTQYDQLVITTAGTITNCTLQVTALPVVPIGTAFAILTNTVFGTLAGQFKNLPEHALLDVGGQLFRIHYNLGGNNVLLVRDSGAAAGQWQPGSPSYSNGVTRLTGTGGSAMIYTIQATTNFLQWTNLGAATGNLTGTFQFTDTNAFRYPYRFYRAVN